MKNNEIYEKITNQIINSLEKGKIPWRKPWAENGSQLPMNYISGKKYNGINSLLLLMRNDASPYYLTFKQAQKIGGKIKKGSKGSIIIYWQVLEFDAKENGKPIKDKHGNSIKETVPLLKYSTVFNLNDIDGFTPLKNREKKETASISKSFIPIEACEMILNAMNDKPIIEHKKESAFYVPIPDKINMPKPENFESNHAYYSTLFHELTHSTGHKKRLDRKLESYNLTRENRSLEELTAELGACFLCAETGINNSDNLQNSKAYIKSWIEVFKNDTKFIVNASRQAQQAVNHILSK